MRLSNSIWGRRIIRAFAVVNLLLVAVGVYAAGESAPSILANVHNSPRTPCVREMYYTMTLIDLACLLTLTVGSVYLWQLNRRGLRICNLVFGAEIAMFLGEGAGFVLSMLGGRWAAVGLSMAAAEGIGGLGTAPQIITAYPVLALVGLNLLRGSFRSHAPQR